MAGNNGSGVNGSGPELFVTPALQWREARAGYVKRLPSGRVARLRPVTPDQLLLSGDVPDLLTPLVQRMVFEGADSETIDQVTKPPENVTKEVAQESIKLMNLVCKLAFVEPRLVDEPLDDTEIGIADVSLDDRGFVYSLCIRPAEVLRSFRLQPPQPVESVPDEQGDLQPTE